MALTSGMGVVCFLCAQVEGELSYRVATLVHAIPRRLFVQKVCMGIPDSYGLCICSFMLFLKKVIVEIGAVGRGDGKRAVILLVVMTSMVPVS